MSKVGLTNKEINMLANAALAAIFQSWATLIPKNVTFGDLAMVLTTMSYLLISKTKQDKTNKIVVPNNSMELN